jgi:mannose-1-phosphate guanylyltransferase
MSKVTPVIPCGGSGTRLWPLSRAGFPKQFLSLTGYERLFQQAAQRLVALGADDIQVLKPLIVTGEEHRFANPGTIPLEIILFNPAATCAKMTSSILKITTGAQSHES